MDTDLHTKSRRMTSKRRGPKTWAAARALYQAGWTARAVADRFDLGIGNLYRRSAKEGWRKDDMPDEPGDWSIDMAPGDEEAVDVRVVARAAIGQAVKLVRLGQFGRAAEAAKAAEMIGRLVERMPDPTVVDAANDAAVMDDLRRKIMALGQRFAEADVEAPRESAG